MNLGRVMYRCLLCLLLAHFGSFAIPDDALRREVNQAIGDLATRRNQIIDRFALVMIGTRTEGRSPDAQTSVPQLNVRLVDKQRRFDLRAVYWGNESGKPTGEDRLQIGSVEKRRVALTRPYRVDQPQDEEDDEFLWRIRSVEAATMDPFDDWVMSSYAFELERSQFRFLDRYFDADFPARYEIVEVNDARPDGERDLVHTSWKFTPAAEPTSTYRWPELNDQLTIVFDRNVKMMPVVTSVWGPVGPYRFTSTEIQWHERDDGHLLPSHIHYTLHGKIDAINRGIAIAADMNCSWLIGDEVPDSVFTAPDHIDELLRQMGLSFQ